MSLAWCLTPFNAPHRHLYGPYSTRDQAKREAMRMLSHEAKRAAAEQLRMPVTLVLTPCHSLCKQPIVVPAHPSPSPSHSPSPSIAYTPVAPAPSPTSVALYRLTEGKLRYFAAQLGITLPHSAATRASIIAILLKELDILGSS